MSARIEQLTRENEALRAELNALRGEFGLPPATVAAAAAAQAAAQAAQAAAAGAQAAAARAQATATAAAVQAQAQAQAAAAQAQARAQAAASAAAASAAAKTAPARPAPASPRALPAASATTTVNPTDLARGVNWPSASSGDAWRSTGSNMPSPEDAFFWLAPARSSPAPLDIAANTPAAAALPPQDPRPLHVVHLAAELAPHAKVGGLGDVVTGLARACLARGHRVQVALPFYEFLKEQAGASGSRSPSPTGTTVVENLKHEGDVDVPKGRLHDGRVALDPLPTSVFSATIAGVPVLLIRPADRARSNLFKGARIYAGGYNETEAYVYFCRAALEWLACSGAQPDVLHLHDWQCAPAAMLFWSLYHASAGGPFQRASVAMSIHNLSSTGEARADEFGAFAGLDPSVSDQFSHVDRALDERTIGHNPERLSLLKGGIVYSAAVVAVSPTYAKEIAADASGWLRPTFAREDVRRKLKGILNGIDHDEWNPASDPHLAANYSAQSPQGKRLCKEFVQRGLGLDVDSQAPLVIAVTRLVPQKGIPLILAAVRRAIELGGQAVVLGTGHADGDFRRLADSDELRGSGRGRVVLLHSEALAHQLYAAADVVLVPSIFEPCGLTQMIAARYGAVPLVRRTGGLADTVADVDDPQSGWPLSRGAGGYVFDAPSEDAVRAALDRCLKRYKEQPEEWQGLCEHNMRCNFSWSGGSAGEYVQVYESLLTS
jgi:starch synthase